MAMTTRLGGVRRVQEPQGLRARSTQENDGDTILRHLVDFLDAFMWQADPATLEITFVTKSVRDILGHSVSDWTGNPERWAEHIHVEDRGRALDALRATARDGLDREVEFRAIDAEGNILVLRSAVRLLVSPSGSAELWGVTTDISGDVRTSDALRESQERYLALSAQAAEFRRQALEDSLTGLPNRILFSDRLATALLAAGRAETPAAVLLMDLDRFKEINDTRGHAAGDAVLKEVALRFRICLRGQDTPARLGGDEFAALLPGTDADGAVRVAERIVRALREPIIVDGSPCTLGASIGIALFGVHGTEPQDLLACADVAMYRAKAKRCGHLIADGGGTMPVPAPPKRFRPSKVLKRTIIGSAAALAILAGATSPAALRRSPQGDSASHIENVTGVLRTASGENVRAAVTDVEQTLAEIPWTEVSGVGVAGALARLEVVLDGLKTDADRGLARRVEQLIATIRDAELAAGMATRSADGRSSDRRVKASPSPSALPNVPNRSGSIPLRP